MLLEVDCGFKIAYYIKSAEKKPGRSHHVHDDVLCVVLCAVDLC